MDFNIDLTNVNEGDENKNQPAEVQKVIQALNAMGFGKIMAPAIAEFFGMESVISKIEADPYILMQMDGISFGKADKVARSYYSVTSNDPRRQRALIYKLVDDSKNLGHTYLPLLHLEKEMAKQNITQVDALATLIRKRELILDDNRIYTYKMFKCETDTAKIFKRRIKDNGNTMKITQPPASLLEGLDEDQAEAVKSSAWSYLMVVTGGPGTGKTHVIKRIADLLSGERVGLCAPTGKAAKRMQELTGRKAFTIHRMLGAGFGTWKYNEQHQLTSYGVVICDESSMLDMDLCYRLIQALPFGTRLILVGDVDQLPPVGPGSPFKDLILTKRVPVVRLRTNHRQGKGSNIATNALAINKGSMQLQISEDFTFVECDSHIDVREKLPEILKNLKKEGYDLIKDVQVLSPQKSTNVGVEELNKFLRHHLNPNASLYNKFAVSDKVMQTVNDYQLKIFNGYCGQIVDETAYTWKIQFFDEEFIFDYPKNKTLGDFPALVPAYCTTVHKFQGSEMKAGICIVSSSHTYMLTRNLLYTAITRFKEKCIIMGDLQALKRAISNTREQDRFSKLYERILD
jgi:exodeoxyribonuclease V alpha subunit